MNHWSEQARPEKAVHEKPGRPIFRPAKFGSECVHCASKPGQGEKCKIGVAQGMMTIEGKMGPGYACSPHDEHDAKMVQLVSKFVEVWAVVGEGVVEGGEDEANGHTSLVQCDGRDVLEPGIPMVRSIDMVKQACDEPKGAEQM